MKTFIFLFCLIFPSIAFAQTQTLRVDTSVPRPRFLHWDMGPDATEPPDILICVTVGNYHECADPHNGAGLNSRNRAGDCEDSFTCGQVFTGVPTTGNIVVSVYDRDLSSNDPIGSSTCTVGRHFDFEWGSITLTSQ